MPVSGPSTEFETQAVEEILHRIASSLQLLMDRDIAVDGVDVERWNERPAGRGAIHISFKLTFAKAGREAQGCLLVPLPEGIAMAGFLMMVGDEEVEGNRALTTLDRGTKDALLELSNFIASAVESALGELELQGVEVRSGGCQGVRADVRPALSYVEGEALVVGRARMRVHRYPEFEGLLLVPEMSLEG